MRRSILIRKYGDSKPFALAGAKPAKRKIPGDELVRDLNDLCSLKLRLGCVRGLCKTGFLSGGSILVDITLGCCLIECSLR